MSTRASRRSIPAGVLWGALGVLLWAAFTIFTGGGAAHADDQDERPLDGLGSVVGGVVSPIVTEVVTPVVTQVVSPVVTEVVAPVVAQAAAPVQQAAPAVVDTVTETVAQVPVAGPAVAPVVQAVVDTATAVTTPITDALQDAPIAGITDPLLDVVSALPVVGPLVEASGLTGLVDSAVGVVDDTAGVVGGVVDETVPPVLDALDPSIPSDTLDVAVPEPSDGRATPVFLATSASALPQGARGALTRGWSSSASPVVDAPADTDSPAHAPAGSPATPAFSAASGGINTSAARLNAGGFPALRIPMQSSGASDDALPTSPVADTDVSPD